MKWTQVLSFGALLFTPLGLITFARSPNHLQITESNSVRQYHKKQSISDDSTDQSPRFLSQSYAIDPLKNIWFVDKTTTFIHVIDTTTRHEYKLNSKIWNTWSAGKNYPTDFNTPQNANYNLWKSSKSNVERFLSITFFGIGHNQILLQVLYDGNTTSQLKKADTNGESGQYNNYAIGFWFGTFDKKYQNFNWTLACVPTVNLWNPDDHWGIGVNNTALSTPVFSFLINRYYDSDGNINFSCVSHDKRNKDNSLGGEWFNINLNQSLQFFQPVKDINNSGNAQFPISLSETNLLFDDKYSQFKYIKYSQFQDENSNCYFDQVAAQNTNQAKGGQDGYIIPTTEGLYDVKKGKEVSTSDGSWQFNRILTNKSFNGSQNFYNAYYFDNNLYVMARNSLINPTNTNTDTLLFKVTGTTAIKIASVPKNLNSSANVIFKINGSTYLLSDSGQKFTYDILNLGGHWKNTLGTALIAVGTIIIILIALTWTYLFLSFYNKRLYKHTMLFAKTKLDALAINSKIKPKSRDCA